MINGAKVRAPAAALALQERLALSRASMRQRTDRSRSASPCSRPTAGWARPSPRPSPTMPASRSTRTMATCWSISRRPPRSRQSLDRAIARGHPDPVGTTGLDDLRRRADRRRGAQDRRCCAPPTPRSASPCSPTWSSAPRSVLGPELGHRDRRGAPPPQGRRAVGHRADARRRGGARARRRRSNEERGRDGTGLKREPGAIGYASAARRHGRRRP